MKKSVNITIETVFDKGSDDENSMVFFTEGIMKKTTSSYTYEYDEAALFQTQKPILGMLEIGEGFVTRSITGEENYVMHFKAGYRERMIYQTPEGSFLTEIQTLDLAIDMPDGIGTALLHYKISFANSESMLTEVKITIKEAE